MLVVNRVGVLSVGRVLGLVYGLIGLIAGAVVSVLSLAGWIERDLQHRPWFFDSAAIIVLPLIYGLGAFLVGMLTAAVYNLAADTVGGIRIQTIQAPEERTK